MVGRVYYNGLELGLFSRYGRRREVEEKEVKNLADVANRVVDKVLAGQDKPVRVIDNIMKNLSDAQMALLNAYQLGLQTNPMAADLPVFQEMQSLGKDIAVVMQKVSKVRGL